MPTTVIGVFEGHKIVRKVREALLEAGARGSDIEILEGDADEIVDEIVERGLDEAEARGYAQAVRRGKIVVAARLPDDKADDAAAIMDRYEANGEGEGSEREETLPEVEEEIAIDKHEVARGGVRVTRRVHEQPVEKTVRLREEQVEVERRPVERELSPEDADAAFQEKTLEMTETSEEVELTKEARVVAEVSLSKRAEERKQTVQDTVRRSEVEVERLDAPKSRKGR